jgi:hypothetical protein
MIQDYAKRASQDIGFSQFETADSTKKNTKFEGVLAEFDCSSTQTYAVSAKEKNKKEPAAKALKESLLEIDQEMQV